MIAAARTSRKRTHKWRNRNAPLRNSAVALFALHEACASAGSFICPRLQNMFVEQQRQIDDFASRESISAPPPTQ
jgi:hypothetical protein